MEFVRAWQDSRPCESLTMEEGANSFEIVVRRLGDPSNSLTVTCGTRNGSATPGENFMAK